MTIQEELQLSYYKQISTLNASHNVFLVQHIETGKLYVKKIKAGVMTIDQVPEKWREEVRRALGNGQE